MICNLSKKVNFSLCYMLTFFVMLWQKTRSTRQFFLIPECRFYPSCSDYFLDAIKKHGLTAGSILSLKRFLKCNPLCKGGIDEVPS